MKVERAWRWILLVGASACASPAPAPIDNGTVGEPPPGPPPEKTNCEGERPSPTHVCVQDCGPPVVREDTPTPPWRWLSEEDAKARAMGGCPKCLPFDSLIATPDGPRPVSQLRIGDSVWSQDATGRRVVAPIAKTSSSPITSPHSFFLIELDDGRRLRASGRHPLSDGKLVGALTIGMIVDGARVRAIVVAPTEDRNTFDVLPASASRTYWADGVLVGSTLAP
ncbi:MAG: hypothetical protein JNK04_25070 [Myxococcales bacterium]|nr:hypothetical protein [Myxococcales bacterium]